jgi:hypothetical protein
MELFFLIVLLARIRAGGHEAKYTLINTGGGVINTALYNELAGQQM